MPLELQDNLGLSGLPYVDQYVGVWSMLEDRFNALRGHAQQINVQLHLDRLQSQEAQTEIKARADTELRVTRDRIAVIELRGTMMKHASSFSANASTVAVRRQVRAAASDDDVVGVLLIADTPGGLVAGTDDLARDVAAAAKRKPVYGYCEDLCASAGYWVMSQATKLFAGPTALVGSIGVFTVVYDYSRMADAEGIDVKVIRFGEFKGMGAAGAKVTEPELAEMKKRVDAFGNDFVDAIATGRSFNRTTAEQLADGRVHKGQAAVDLKLVDGIQSLDDTLTQLVQASQQPQKRRNQAMSEANDPTTPAAPLAASLAELKSALPDASSDFLLKQLEEKATLSTALTNYAAELAAENKKLKDAAAEAEKAKPKAKTGNQPLADVDDQDVDRGGQSAKEVYDETFNAYLDKGKTRAEATQLMNSRHRELRVAMVTEVNAKAKRPCEMK
jgi:signal peptide peptidase SppA